MRKLLIVLTYFTVFWIFLPVMMIRAGLWVDGALGLPALKSRLLQTCGAGMAFGASVPLFLAVYQFRRYGQAWPISVAPPDRLIREGLFAWIRHPIYLFYDLVLLGVGLFLRSRGFLFFVLIPFLAAEAVYIVLEEKVLRRRFGKNYEYYRRTTGLFCPRLYQLLRIPFHLIFSLWFSYRKRYEAEEMPAPPFFVVALHNNYLDPLFIAKAFPQPIAFVTTYEMFRTLPGRLLFRSLFCIPKRRFCADVLAVRKIFKILQCGGAVGIFPEGERSWTGAAQALKPEVLKLFQRLYTIPVVPVRIRGSYHAWPRWGSRFRRAAVEVTVEKPIRFEQPPALREIGSALRQALHVEGKGGRCRSGRYLHDIFTLLYRCPVCGSFESFSVAGKGGNRFVCRRCETRFTLKPDYSVVYLSDRQERVRSLKDIYEEIRTEKLDFPVKVRYRTSSAGNEVPSGEGEGIVGWIGHCDFEMEREGKFQRVARGPVVITRSHLFARQEPGVKIPLQSVRSVTIEGRARLQLYDAASRRLYQIRFWKGSALRWQDFLAALLQAKYHVSPNRT